MHSTKADGSSDTSGSGEPKTLLPPVLTLEQVAAIRDFGDSVVESVSISERLRRAQNALENRRRFRVV
jgi:hypothetical protein